MFKTNHIHASQRFDRPLSALWNAIKFFITMCDVVTLTEMGNDRRLRTIAKFTGWGVAHVDDARKGEDECALMYARWKWELVSVDAIRLSHMAHPRRGVFCYGLKVALRHKRTGKVVLFFVIHAPSGVEGRDGWSDDGYRVKWYGDIIDTLSHKMSTYRAGGRYAAVVVTGDWNLNLRRRIWKQYFEKKFDNYHLAWDANMPNGGTHLSRLIDGSFLWGARVFKRRIRILPRRKASDHRPFKETLIV